MHWTTRARPHIDRCATAWLIRRFVDPEARFSFIDRGQPVPQDTTPFDLPGVPHGHRDGACTFETVIADYRLDDAALGWIAARIHDIDFHALELPESPGLDTMLRGVLLAEPDDHKVLDITARLFDGLYAWAQAKTTKE